MRILFYFLTLIILFASCTNHIVNANAKTINRLWLDSIIKNSDSSYSKPYKRTDFVTAVFYINKKDSSVCQVMKDSADSICQIIIAKNNVRSFFAQYYANGVLQASLPLDQFGQHHGTATFYYADGSIQSTGNFNHGLKTGDWKVYDEKGKLTVTDKYDNNGQLMQPQQP